MVRASRLAMEPLVDRPGVRVIRARLPLRQRHGNRQRKLAGERRKPPLFLVHRQCVLSGTGQSDEHSGTEAERPVVPATVGNGLHREPGPLRELPFNERAHLLRINGDALWRRTEIRRVTQQDVLSGVVKGYPKYFHTSHAGPTATSG
jgi:hypothetical protein